MYSGFSGISICAVLQAANMQENFRIDAIAFLRMRSHPSSFPFFSVTGARRRR